MARSTELTAMLFLMGVAAPTFARADGFLADEQRTNGAETLDAIAALQSKAAAATAGIGPERDKKLLTGAILSPDGYVLAGHLHPLSQLVGKGKQTVKLPCFWFGAHCGVLPAFGSFIDGAIVHSLPGDDLFVVASNQVLNRGRKSSK